MSHELLSELKPYPALPSGDINGAALADRTGYRIKLGPYKRVIVQVITKTLGGNSALTFEQHTAATAGTSKALAFTKAKRIIDYTAPATSNVLADVTVSANSLTIATASGNTQMILVEFYAAELDIQGGYYWLSPILSDPSVASVVSINYIAGENRMPGVDGDLV